MNIYIATFFTHYDAILYKRELNKHDINGKMMPVPRKLSSSCGTCISFEAAKEQINLFSHDTSEMLVQKEKDNYICIVDNR